MKTFILTIISLTTLASTTNFDLEFSVENLDSGQLVSNLKCNVRQTLTWESQSNFFKCETLDEKIFTFKNISTTVGYNHDYNLAYTIYPFGGKNGLFENIRETLNILEMTQDSSGLKIYYEDESPSSTSDEFIVNTKGATYLIKILGLKYL